MYTLDDDDDDEGSIVDELAVYKDCIIILFYKIILEDPTFLAAEETSSPWGRGWSVGEWTNSCSHTGSHGDVTAARSMAVEFLTAV